MKSEDVLLLKEQLDKVMAHHNDETDRLLKSLRSMIEKENKFGRSKSPKA